MTRFQVWLNVGGVGFLQADTLETEEQAIEVARSIAKRCPHTNTGVYSVSPVHSFRHETEKKRKCDCGEAQMKFWKHLEHCATLHKSPAGAGHNNEGGK